MCDCRATPVPEAERGRALDAGGAILELRGEASMQRDLPALVRRARDAGWAEVRVRTNAVAFQSAESARAIAAAGVTGAVVQLTSERADVHDAIARVKGAHAAALRGLRALGDAGLELTLELPVLAPSLQHPARVLEQALGAAPIARLRLYSPPALIAIDGRLPRELQVPRWDAVRAALVETIALAKARGVEVSLSEREGIPLCAIATRGADGKLSAPAGVLVDRGNRPMPRTPTSTLGAACASCPAQRRCPGTTSLSLRTHGGADLEPVASAPARVEADAWDDTRQDVARAAFGIVLRPTVHCNQDCWFCSANETSKNLEENPARMLRRIARVARTGITQVTFSGGEPALSKHLVQYVAAARKVGIPRIELVTNAALLDRRERADALVEAGVTNVFVSLHAFNESQSQLETRKAGDHARTVQALHHFARHPGVRLDVNHVISAHNYRSLVRFVEWLHGEFGDRIGISFAWVTPQYRALDRLGRVPRFRDGVPYLKRALARSAELGLDVVVGSRQGVPPCQLGEFLPFSDILSQTNGALTEDAPQKVQGPACASCRFRAICPGLWKPYAEQHGFDELVAVPGEVLDPRVAPELAVGAKDEAPEVLVVGDGRMPRASEVPLPEEEGAPDLPAQPGALAVAIAGSGLRALAIARALRRVPGLELVGVASPHATEKDLPELPATVRRAASVEALGPVDAVIVAAHTRAHAALAREALARGLPCLVEKPLAGTLADARALAAEGGQRLTVFQQLRLAGGVDELRELAAADRPTRVTIVHRATASSPASIHAWSRPAFYELLLHLGDLAALLAGGPLAVRQAQALGDGRPRHVVVKATGPGGVAVSIELQLEAPADGLSVELEGRSGARARWQRDSERDEVDVFDATGAGRTRTPPRGGDLERLLQRWRDAVRTGGPPPVSAEEGVQAMQLAEDAVAALEAAGAPFTRASEPRRVASSALREGR